MNQNYQKFGQRKKFLLNSDNSQNWNILKQNDNNNNNNKTNNKTNNNINTNTLNPNNNKKQKIIFPDESVYEGYLKNNEFDGYGEYKTKNYTYIGNFVNGKKQGKGKLEDYTKNIEYEGEFKNNMKNGYGEEKYRDGSIYKGQFKDDMKHGKGKLLLHGNGNYGYEGEFKNDKISGKGKFKWNDSKEYIGEWDNNEISGYGIIIEGKMRHIGYFCQDVKEGFGATFYVDQNFALLGKWENNLIEGPAILVNLSENRNDNIFSMNKNSNNNIKLDSNNEIIVGMCKGEIINMNLDEEDLFRFKNSKDYQEMHSLYKAKFYPDYQRYIIEKII